MQVSAVDPRPNVRFRLLDPFRGLAALWVFTFHFHFSDAFQQTFPDAIRVFRVGHLGVPMFFVISGYCLMASVRTALRDRESVRSFLYRRSVRIYPPFWFSVAIVAALPFIIEGLSALKTGVFLRPTADGNTNNGFLIYTPLEWIRVLTLTQVFAPVEVPNLQAKFATINAVYWTLAIEFQFYLVMALALACRARAVLVIGVVTVIALPFWYLGGWHVTGIFLPYWPMFALGIALYLLQERGLSAGQWIGTNDVKGWIIVVMAAGAGTIYVATAPMISDLGFALAFATILWSVHWLDNRYRNALRSGGVLMRGSLGLWQALGLMSYSLYLLHGRLQFLSHQLVRQVVPTGIAFDIVAIILTCVGCYAFYKLCEKPFIRSRVAPVAFEPPRSVPARAISIPVTD